MERGKAEPWLEEEELTRHNLRVESFFSACSENRPVT
jgi:hypothetical protein